MTQRSDNCLDLHMVDIYNANRGGLIENIGLIPGFCEEQDSGAGNFRV